MNPCRYGIGCVTRTGHHHVHTTTTTDTESHHERSSESRRRATRVFGDPPKTSHIPSPRTGALQLERRVPQVVQRRVSCPPSTSNHRQRGTSVDTSRDRLSYTLFELRHHRRTVRPAAPRLPDPVDTRASRWRTGLELDPARTERVRAPLELATVLVGLHPAKFPGGPRGPDCRAHKTLAPDFLQGHDAQLEDLRELHVLHSLPAANRHHNAASLCRRIGSRRLGLHPKTLYHPDPFSQVIVFSHQSLKSDPHGGRRVSCDYAQR